MLSANNVVCELLAIILFKCDQYPVGPFMIMLILTRSVAGFIGGLFYVDRLLVKRCCVMSGNASSDASPKPCLCAACVAPRYGMHAPTGQPVESISHFENMRAVAAERLMIPFKPSPVGFQPLAFPQPMGVTPPSRIPHSLAGHYPMFPEDNDFRFAAEFTDMQTSPKQQPSRGYRNTNSRGKTELLMSTFSPGKCTKVQLLF